jgi:hypothetical protein
MKCRECAYMSEFEDGLYRCTNHDSTNYMMYTGICCEDECEDGDYLVPQKQEDE